MERNGSFGTSKRSDLVHDAASTGTLAQDRNPVRVHAQFASIAVEPLQGGIVVVDRTRIPRFGRKPVLDRYRDTIQFVAELLKDRLSFTLEDFLLELPRLPENGKSHIHTLAYLI